MNNTTQVGRLPRSLLYLVASNDESLLDAKGVTPAASPAPVLKRRAADVGWDPRQVWATRIRPAQTRIKPEPKSPRR